MRRVGDGEWRLTNREALDMPLWGWEKYISDTGGYFSWADSVSQMNFSRFCVLQSPTNKNMKEESKIINRLSNRVL